MHADDHDALDPAGTTGSPEHDAEASTGDPGVDHALDRLVDLEGLSVKDHVAVFDAVHAALQGRLADVED